MWSSNCSSAVCWPTVLVLYIQSSSICWGLLICFASVVDVWKNVFQRRSLSEASIGFHCFPLFLVFHLGACLYFHLRMSLTRLSMLQSLTRYGGSGGAAGPGPVRDQEQKHKNILSDGENTFKKAYRNNTINTSLYCSIVFDFSVSLSKKASEFGYIINSFNE